MAAGNTYQVEAASGGPRTHEGGELRVFFAREALLIAENDPSPRLEELLDKASAGTMPSQSEDAAMFAQWVGHCGMVKT